MIFRSVGAALAALGGAMAIPAATALATGEDVGPWAFGALTTLAAAAGLIALGAGRRRPSDLRAAIAVVLLWWTTAPAFAAIPFAVAGLPPVDALFEAASALTTTGGWLSETGARDSAAGTVWRALLQWIGGLASLAVAAAIFVRPAFLGIDTLLPPFARGARDSDLRALWNALRAFAPVYALMTAACALALAFAGAPVFDAAVTSLSIVASGGFSPAPEGPAAYGAAVGAAALPFMFLSGANFILAVRIVQRRPQRLQDLETGAYVGIAFVLTLTLWLFTGAGDLDRLPAQAFNAVSLASTNGFVAGEAPPLALALIAALIGGAAVSTAGGLKVLRWIVIFRRTGEEVNRLVLPDAVSGRRAVVNELGVWMHFLALTTVLAVLTLILASGGEDFILAAAGAAGAVANTGPLLHLAAGGAEGYAAFDGAGLRLALVAAMILGRLEAVTALVLINAGFWRS